MTGNNNTQNKPQFIGKTRWEVYMQQISATFHEILSRINAACLTTCMSKSSGNIFHYYINTNEIQGELSCKNLISSHVKISPLLWLHNKSHLSHQKTIKVKWFGISLVFI